MHSPREEVCVVTLGSGTLQADYAYSSLGDPTRWADDLVKIAGTR